VKLETQGAVGHGFGSQGDRLRPGHLSGTVTTKDANLVRAYDALKVASDKVKDFWSPTAFPKPTSPCRPSRPPAATTRKSFPRLPQAPGLRRPRPPSSRPTGRELHAHAVRLHQFHRHGQGPGGSRAVTSLIKEGVEIDSGAPCYLYTKLSELKINMLAEATKDATTRAEQIVDNAHGHLGKLVEARMGVMQINPKGVSATSARASTTRPPTRKKITAVVSVKFEVK